MNGVSRPHFLTSWGGYAVALILLAAVYYVSNQGNYFIDQAGFSDLLPSIFVEAGEIILSDAVEPRFRGHPSLYAVIPSWLYRKAGLGVELIIESMAVLLILMACFGMAALASSAARSGTVFSLACAAYYLFSDIGALALAFTAKIGPNVLNNEFGLAVLLFVFAAFFRSSYRLAGFLLGILFCVHPPHSVLAGLPVLSAFLIREWRNPAWWKIAGQAFGLFLLGAAPSLMVLLPHSAGILGTGGEVPVEKLMEFLRIRNPHHSFPSEWHPARFVVFGLFLVISWLGRSLLHRESQPAFSALFWSYLGFLGMCYVLIEIVPVYSVIKLNPFRASSQLTTVCVAPFFLYLIDRIRRSDGSGGVVSGFFAVWILAGTFFSGGGIPLFPATALLADGALCRWFSRGAVARLHIAMLAASSALTGLFHLPAVMPYDPVRLIYFFWFGSYLALAPWKAAVIVLAGAAGCAAVKMLKSPRAVAASGLALLAGLCVVVGLDQWRHRRAGQPRPNAFLEAQRWAYENTSIGTVFVADPRIRGFRDLSRRDVFLAWGDLSYASLYPSLYEEYLRRMAALSVSIGDLKPVRDRSGYLSERFSRLPAHVFQSIRKDHPECGYVLYDNATNTDITLPVVFQNAFYTICRID